MAGNGNCELKGCRSVGFIVDEFGVILCAECWEGWEQAKLVGPPVTLWEQAGIWFGIGAGVGIWR